MRIFKYLGNFCVILLAFTLTVSAKNHKAEKFWKEGRDAELRKEYDKALGLYEQAQQTDPKDPAYQLAARRVRFQAAAAHVDAGIKLRNAGKLEEALAELQKAYAIDASYAIAEQEIRKTREMIDREQKTGAGQTGENRGLTPAQKAQKQSEERAASIMSLPELKPLNTKVPLLRMNNQPPKVLFETLGKVAGINVIFDPEYQPPTAGGGKFTVDLTNTTVEEALDYLAVQTKSFWKPLSPNTIFVTQDNVQKRRDFEDYVVKVFYIHNATTVQELQDISSTVRSVTEIRRAFVYNGQFAILMRGTADQMALAEKLIQDLDKPKSEVVVDVIIMEANRSKVRDLAATFFTSGAAGIKIPIAYNPGGATTTTTTTPTRGGGTTTGTGTTDTTTTTTTTGSTATTSAAVAITKLKDLKLFGDFSVAVPSGLLQAVVSDSQTRVLQQPQVRAVDMGKATLKIGDKIPYASGSLGGGLGGAVGVGISPVVQTSFNFADVGVNVDMTPRIHGRDEVSLHIDIELSNLNRYVDIGGISQPVISSRHIVHDIRLREGEVNLLGGLLNVQDSGSVSGVPGLATLPILGPLFGTHHKDQSRGELLIALVPHVVRAPDLTETNLRGVAAGNDANVKLNFSHKADPEQPAPAPGQGTSTAQPVSRGTESTGSTPSNVPGTTPAQNPAAVPQLNTTPAPGSPLPTTTTPQPGTPVTPPGAATRLFFNPTTIEAAAGAPVTVSLQVENAADLFAAPVHLKYDPKVIRLLNVRQGTLLGSGAQQVNFNENTQNDKGESSITLNRLAGTPGVNGSGTLLSLTFQAVGKGTSNITIPDPELKNSQMQPISAAAPSVKVVVQ